MSGGLNKLFRRNVLQFMRDKNFNTNPAMGMPVVAGVYRFNIANNGAFGGHPVAEIQRAGANVSRFSNAFDAYYLPFFDQAQTTIVLGGAADYFFTPALTGCRLIFQAGGVINHMAGSFGDAAMDAVCNLRADTTTFPLPRYWDNGDHYASVVVGQRSGGTWQFYQQSLDYGHALPVSTTRV